MTNEQKIELKNGTAVKKNRTADVRPGLLIASLGIPLAVGVVSSLLTSDAMKIFHFMNKPPLSPPGWLFPIVWTILYLMMGLASYYVFRSEADRSIKRTGLALYGAQLVFNFFWSLLFFNASLYMVSFIWLMIMWALTIMTMLYFHKADRKAGWMMLPLVVWTTFAAYLNLGIYILSITPSIQHR